MFTSILRGLLSQLISQSPDLIPYCHDKRSTSGELTLRSASLAKQLVELYCQRPSKLYIIIDGLDECNMEERKLILFFFNSMVERHNAKDPGKIRVLFISQDWDDIRKALTTAARIALCATDNEADIRSFVRKWSLKIQQKFKLEDSYINYITDSTCNRSAGMN